VSAYVLIEPLPGTGIAEEKEVARQIREEVIKPALREGEEVVIDFDKTDITTQSFIHALLADPICRFGEKALDLIVFKNYSEQIKQIITTVIEYTFMAIEEGGDPLEEPQGEGA
jgi:hypothetical protein